MLAENLILNFFIRLADHQAWDNHVAIRVVAKGHPILSKGALCWPLDLYTQDFS